MGLVQQQITCSFKDGEAELNVYSQAPGKLSFVTLKDLYDFVSKERTLAYNTMKTACNKFSVKCMDRQLIEDMSRFKGAGGRHATSFLYIKTKKLVAALRKLDLPENKVMMVHDALAAVQESVYARQQVVHQQLAAASKQQPIALASGQPEIAVHVQLATPAGEANAGSRSNAPQPAQPLFIQPAPASRPNQLQTRQGFMKATTDSDKHLLLSLLPYGSDSEEDVPQTQAPSASAVVPLQPESSSSDSQDEEPNSQGSCIQDQQPSPGRALALTGLSGLDSGSRPHDAKQPTQQLQPLRPLEQTYTSIPDVDWSQRCPELLAKRTPINHALLSGTPVRTGVNNAPTLITMSCIIFFMRASSCHCHPTTNLLLMCVLSTKPCFDCVRGRTTYSIAEPAPHHATIRQPSTFPDLMRLRSYTTSWAVTHVCTLQVQALLDAYSKVFRDPLNTIRAQLGANRWSDKTTTRNLGTLQRVIPWLMRYKGWTPHQVDMTVLVDTNIGMLYASFLRQKMQGDYQEVRRVFQAFVFFCGFLSTTSKQSGVDAAAALAAREIYKGLMTQVFPFVKASQQQRKDDAAADREPASTLAVTITAWQASIVAETWTRVQQEVAAPSSLTFETARRLRDVLMLCVLVNYGCLVSRPSFIITPKTSKFADTSCTHTSCARGKTCKGNYFRFDGDAAVLVLSHHKNESRTHNRLEISFTDPVFVAMLRIWEQQGRACFLDNANCILGNNVIDHSPDPELDGLATLAEQAARVELQPSEYLGQ